MPRIDVKSAVTAAAEMLKELIPDAKDIRLEEIEMDEAGPWWDVTLSYADPHPNPFDAIVKAPSNRIYKTVQLHLDTGEFHSIKIRKP